jgi:non-ribosomal peptide synthetase component F
VSHIPADLTAEIRALVRKTNATLFSTLLTAFQNTLAQWSKVEDIVVGTPVANRSKKAVHETMGYFSGVVPLRGQVDSSRSFSDSVRAVHRETTDCFAHAMPFAELARALGDQAPPGCNPVFDVRFALQNHPIPDISLSGLSIQLRMRSTGTARFDLGCEVTEDADQLEVVWLSRRGLFSQADIDELHELYLAILSEGCRSSGSRAGVLTS